MPKVQSNHKPLAWIAASALFMQSLDATILNTALPSIAADLHQSPLEMQMTIISYALTVALFIPLSGWIADKYGTLTTFRISVFLFVIGSIACACSTNLNSLVISRILQGVGGSMMMPVARLAIIRVVPKVELLPIWNLMAMMGLVGPIVGPILGGWLVTYAHWHWIFLINIPIGAIGIALATIYMQNVKGEQRKLDWTGFFLFGIGLVGVTLGLDLLNEHLFSACQSVSILVCGFLFILAYYFYALRAANPLIPLSLFQIRTFRIGIIANIFVRLCGSGIPFLIPLMLQVAFHYGADIAGFVIVPTALSSILSKSLIEKILNKYSYKQTLIASTLGMGLSIFAMAFLQQHSPLWCYVVLLICYGGCLSTVFTAINTLTICDLEQQTASAGTTMLSVVQQVGIGIGIVVAALILTGYRNYFGEQDLANAFSYTYISIACFAIILIAILSRLHHTDGNQLQKHKAKS